MHTCKPHAFNLSQVAIVVVQTSCTPIAASYSEVLVGEAPLHVMYGLWHHSAAVLWFSN